MVTIIEPKIVSRSSYQKGNRVKERGLSKFKPEEKDTDPTKRGSPSTSEDYKRQGFGDIPRKSGWRTHPLSPPGT